MISHHPPFVIHYFDVLDSTNDYLKSLSEAPEFTVIVAGAQTSGRGRRDRTWHSSPGEGLYFSLLLRPTVVNSSLALIGLYSAIAVAETLMGLAIDGVDIKWPNDVLIDDRKVCGILAEGTSSLTSRVIVGIGVNLNHRAFPKELSETATSVYLATGRETEATLFLHQVLERIGGWHAVWTAGGSTSIVDRWQELSSYAFGRHVRVATDSENLSGITQGLSSDGGLVLRTTNDKRRTILSGEVSRVRADEP